MSPDPIESSARYAARVRELEVSGMNTGKAQATAKWENLIRGLRRDFWKWAIALTLIYIGVAYSDVIPRGIIEGVFCAAFVLSISWIIVKSEAP